MQHSTVFLTLRPHAEGRPEDAALELFPLEERILVVLAQQQWASAADLAKRLDVSESDIHKACHELEENKKLIVGRDLGHPDQPRHLSRVLQPVVLQPALRWNTHQSAITSYNHRTVQWESVL